MSNEPKWTAEYNADTMDSVFARHTPTYKTFTPDETAAEINALESEVERLKGDNESIAKDWSKACKQSENWQAKYHEMTRAYHTVASERDKLQSDLDRCKSERLGAEEIAEFVDWFVNYQESYFIEDGEFYLEVENQKVELKTMEEVITAFRASQQTQDGKGLLSSSEQGKCRICGGNDCDSDSHK